MSSRTWYVLRLDAFSVWSNVVLDRAWRSRTWAAYHLQQDRTILPFKRNLTPTHRPSSWFLATLSYQLSKILR